MITYFDDITPGRITAPVNGQGAANSYPYETLKGISGKIIAFNMMHLEKNSAIGYHIHENNSEVYFMLEGVGVYSDNGELKEVKRGDLMLCKKGEGHSLKAINNDSVTFLAFILE